VSKTEVRSSNMKEQADSLCTYTS